MCYFNGSEVFCSQQKIVALLFPDISSQKKKRFIFIWDSQIFDKHTACKSKVYQVVRYVLIATLKPEWLYLSTENVVYTEVAQQPE